MGLAISSAGKGSECLNLIERWIRVIDFTCSVSIRLHYGGSFIFRFRFFLLAFLFVTFPAWGQTSTGKLEIHHIDMGQGDSAILISPLGETVLFDAGADMAHRKHCDSIVDYLDQAGVREIDYLFVSHYHSDHIGCIPAVLARFPLRHEAYDRGQSYKSTQYENYVKAVGAHRTTALLGHSIVLDAGSGHPVTITVEALNGTYAGGSVAAKDENDVSLIALIAFGAFREEIGGDLSGEATGEYVDVETSAALSVGELDVYKVHHHCSSHSSNDNWMAATKPTVAIISTGDGNDYGHPTADCLERLHDAEIAEAYWTEKGNGQTPGPKDQVSGDIIVTVPEAGNTYTISHNDGAIDTYPVKGAEALPPVKNESPSIPANSPLYEWSVKSKYYYDSTCPAVNRISRANLQSGSTPPPGKIHFDCSGR